jgi:hypothetical protein
MSRHPSHNIDFLDSFPLVHGEFTEPRFEGVLRFKPECVELKRKQASFGMYLVTYSEEGKKVFLLSQDASRDAERRVTAPAVDAEDFAAECIVVDVIAKFCR